MLKKFNYIVCVCRCTHMKAYSMFLENILMTFTVGVGMYTHVPPHLCVWRLEDNLLKSVLSFHHMCPRDGTQAISIQVFTN